MTAWQILTAVEAALRPGIEAQKGVLTLSGDINHYVELLGTGPQSWRAIIGFEGEDAFGSEGARQGGLVEGTFLFTVQHNRGMAIDVGGTIYKGDRAPILFLSDTVNTAVRSCQFAADLTDVDGCRGFVFKERNWIEPRTDEQKIFRALQSKFTLHYSLPAAADPLPLSLGH